MRPQTRTPYRIHSKILVAAAAALCASPVFGDENHSPEIAEASQSAWQKANDWSIGNILFPSLHLHGVGGLSSGDVAELASGGHDPQREAFSAQALEPSLSFKTPYFEAFANYIFFQDAHADWDGELEEAFGKITNIPGGFEIKGGQFLSRFGAQNNTHLHAWNFVDSETVLSRFLGDEGLMLQGGEISWTIPMGLDPVFTLIASSGYGETLEHDHSHNAGHDHDEESALFEGEESGFADSVWTARLLGRYRSSDFHTITAGVSWAGGDNGFQRDTQVAGIDVEYLWRENGLEPGGRAFRWRNELLWRNVDAYSDGSSLDADHDDHDDHESEEEHAHHAEEHGHEEEDHADDAGAAAGPRSASREELGLYSHLIYTWNEHLDTGLRIGWVEGIEDFGLAERLRISPAISYWFDKERRIGLRTQYNYDRVDGSQDEHSLWFQVNIALGSNTEVR